MTSNRRFFIDNSGPDITITSPQPNAVIQTGPQAFFEFSAVITDCSPIQFFEFRVGQERVAEQLDLGPNDQERFEDAAGGCRLKYRIRPGPFRINMPLNGLFEAGLTQLTVRATDQNGFLSEVSIPVELE